MKELVYVRVIILESLFHDHQQLVDHSGSSRQILTENQIIKRLLEKSNFEQEDRSAFAVKKKERRELICYKYHKKGQCKILVDSLLCDFH